MQFLAYKGLNTPTKIKLIHELPFLLTYFNVKRTIWLKGYQNGNHIEPLSLLVTLKSDMYA